MIHSFTCKIFYSFSEEVTLDFVVNDNAPENNGYFTAKSGTRLSKVETVIGSNASGKTNLLKILPFLKWLIIDSFNSKPEDLIVIQPFAFGDTKSKPSNLSVVFEISGKIYTYEFIITKEKILSEELKLTKFVKTKKSTKKIFSRQWNEKTNNYDFDGETFDLPKEFKNLLRINASVIGAAARLNHTESQMIAKYWGQIETNVVEAGWIGDHLLPTSIFQLNKAFGFFSENSMLKAEAEKLLCRFDLGLSGFEITKEKKENEENGFTLNVRATHLVNGQKQYLPVRYESSGTKQLFVLLKSILVALEKGSIAIVDEFDINLHPEMVIALYDLFVQPETNPKNAQLIFTSHETSVMTQEIFRRDQIWFCEKKNKATELYSLAEFKTRKGVTDIEKGYFSGRYGALPYFKSIDRMMGVRYVEKA